MERPLFTGRDTSNAPLVVEIDDPVGRARYVLDTQAKVAHKQALPEPAEPRKLRLALASKPAQVEPRASVSATERPKPVVEHLEPQMIEGVMAEGNRQTTTWPEGSHWGNDRPVKEVFETWRSPELKLNILSKVSEPGSGDETTRLINLSRDEPDQSLFQVPPDYTVVEEKAEFSIQWSSTAAH